MGELVPYAIGMQQGQGFNTFLQQGCIREAVTVTAGESPSNPFTRDYSSELIEDYEKLVKSLNISAGAAISGWGQSGRVDVSYLDRSEFEKSTLTYQVKVNVQQQGSTQNKYSFNNYSTENPNTTYGDRYIANFIRGGYFFARVSISTTSKSHQEEVKQAAKVAFKMYGVTGEVTNEVKTAVESIQKHSEVKIVIHESTGTSQGVETRTESAGSDLLSIKTRADKFYDDASAGIHNYIRFAVLGKYTNISNFNNAFSPLDYTEANKRSWALLDDFTKYLAMEGVVGNIPPEKYMQGSSQKFELQNRRLDEVQSIRHKVAKISADPDDARVPSTHMPPETFRNQVYHAVKTVVYIAQSKPTKCDDNWTDIAQTTLVSGATKLFEFKAYDFGDITGTSVISFGKRNSSESYVCLIGERANEIHDWKEESCFWIFPEMVATVADQMVVVSKLVSKNYIRLALGDDSDKNNPRPGFRFYFYTGATQNM